MQIKCLLAALLLGASPTLLAADIPDLDDRVARGRDLLTQVGEHSAALVLAQTPQATAAALARLEAVRDQGVANAAYELAFLYIAGRFGITPDLDEARRNYEIAVGQELAIALADFGLMLYTGHHFAADPERGLTLLNRAAELGDLRAITFLVDLLRMTALPQDLVKADAWFDSLGMRDSEFVPGIDGDAATRAQDYAYGQASIYVLLRDGVILAADPDLAESWLQRIDPQYAAMMIDGIASTISAVNQVQSNQQLALSLQEFAMTNPNPTIVNNHAWLLATARSDDLRDGAKAVQLMEGLLLEIDAPSYMIDTLAAAYAEAGDFAAARLTQEKANEMFAAEAQNVDVGRQHLDAYAEGRAWRE